MMFDFIQACHVDLKALTASGMARVAAEHPLFFDHFPGKPLLPGSMGIEILAQIASPLVEEISRAEHAGLAKWALLSMVRSAKFLQPIELPSELSIHASYLSAEGELHRVLGSIACDESIHMQAELVLRTIPEDPQMTQASLARKERIRRWEDEWVRRSS